jgi:hypothetical protein
MLLGLERLSRSLHSFRDGVSPCVRRFPCTSKGSAADGLPSPVRRKPGGRWLLAGEGRWLRLRKGRWSCTKKLANTFVWKTNARQVVARKRRQVSVGGLSATKKTAVSLAHHCSLSVKRPVKHCEGDGLKKGAGDGARTRDSLLGRQELYH